jgi:tetratricopeptide (TPR) repeat protein
MLEQALSQSSKYAATHPEWLFDAHYALGNSYFNKGMPEKSLKEQQAALEVYKNPDASDRLTAACAISAALRHLGRISEAEEFCKKTIAAFEKIGGHITVSRLQAYMAYAEVLADNHKIKESYDVAMRALVLSDDEDDRRASRSAISLAWLAYMDAVQIGKEKQTRKELDKTKNQLRERVNNNEDVGRECLHYAHFAFNIGWHEEAKEMTNLALQAAPNAPSPQTAAYVRTDGKQLLKQIEKHFRESQESNHS